MVCIYRKPVVANISLKTTFLLVACMQGFHEELLINQIFNYLG
jgi:hypothetical protein